jgi:hypothetical protein
MPMRGLEEVSWLGVDDRGTFPATPNSKDQPVVSAAISPLTVAGAAPA